MSQDNAKQAKSWILYEDDAIVVINKPADLAVQGGSGIKQSLADFLPALMKPGADTLPMLVHRLDQHASGVLLLARTKEAARKLSKAWEAHETRKLYWAVTMGVPKRLAGNLKTRMVRVNDSSGVKVSLYSEPKPENPKIRRLRRKKEPEPEAAPAEKLGPDEVKMGVTNYHTLAHSGDIVSLLALRPRTGRTHQLRVHCSEALQTPMLGDYKYGTGINGELQQMLQVITPLKKGFTVANDASSSSSSSKETSDPIKLHLHARELAIRHPTTGKLLHFTAPLPSHFQQTLKVLGLDIDKSSDIAAFATLTPMERKLEEKKPVWKEEQERLARRRPVLARARKVMKSTQKKNQTAKQKSVKVIGKAKTSFGKSLKRAKFAGGFRR